jgi:hypothetical protein
VWIRRLQVLGEFAGSQEKEEEEEERQQQQQHQHGSGRTISFWSINEGSLSGLQVTMALGRISSGPSGKEKGKGERKRGN